MSRSNRPEDCLGCKLVGSGAAFGLTGYALYERARVQVPKHAEGTAVPPELMKAVRQARNHRALLLGMAGVFAGMGVWRAFIM